MALWSACGRIDYDLLSADSGEQADAGASTACAFGPFQTLTELSTVNTTAHDWVGSVTADELVIAYRSDGIFTATRGSTADMFSSPAAHPALPVNGSAEDPGLSGDGLELIYIDVEPSGRTAMYRATRLTRAGPFSAPELLFGDTADFYRVLGPDLSGDGLTVYFGAISRDTESTDLWTATRPAVGAPFGSFARVDIPDRSPDDNWPTVSVQGLEVMFERLLASGRWEIWRATRASVTEPFSAPAPLEISAPAWADGDPELSADGRTLYFSRSAYPEGRADMWMATRDCL